MSVSSELGLNTSKYQPKALKSHIDGLHELPALEIFLLSEEENWDNGGEEDDWTDDEWGEDESWGEEEDW